MTIQQRKRYKTFVFNKYLEILQKAQKYKISNKEHYLLVINCKHKVNFFKRSFANELKHDIMHSAKLKTMCSANKDFAVQIYQKGLCGKAFGLKLSTPKLWLKPLKR